MTTRKILGMGEVEFPDTMSDAEVNEAVKEIKASNRALRGDEKSPYLPLIESEARKRGLDPNHMIRMAQYESGLNPLVTSPRGAGGLFQMMPDTAKEVNVANVYDPETNVKGGLDYYAKLLKRFGGDHERATIAYNWGPGNLIKHEAAKAGDKRYEKYAKLPQETQDYVTNVLLGVQRPMPAATQETPQAPSTPSLEGIKGVANPRAGQPEAGMRPLPELVPVTDDMSFTERLGARAQNYGTGIRKGWQAGMHQLARQPWLPTGPLMNSLYELGITAESPAERQKRLDFEASQAPGGTTGQVAAGFAQSGPFLGTTNAIRQAPGLLGRVVQNPYGAGAVEGFLQGAGTSTGGIGDRTASGLVNAGLSLPATALARGYASPINLRPEARELIDVHGVRTMPPLSVGAENRFIRNTAALTHGISPQAGLASRFQDDAMQRLWERATPRGMPNALAEQGGHLRQGDVFTVLDNQINTAYNNALRNTRIPITQADSLALDTRVGRLPQGEAATVGRIVRDEIGEMTGANQGYVRISGQQWRNVRDNIRQLSENQPNTPAGARVREQLDAVLDTWDNMFNARVPRQTRVALDLVDENNAYRQMLSRAGDKVGDNSFITPATVKKQIAADSPEGVVSQGQGRGQDITDPLLRMNIPTDIKSSWQQSLRGLYPVGAGASVLALASGLDPHISAIPLGVSALAGASGFNPLMRQLYGRGMFGTQQRTAQLLRDYPGFMGALVSSRPTREFE